MGGSLPPLNALRAFEAAARHGSMSLAAEELHVTAGAVSQQIKELERHLGTPLFTRKTRHIALTDEGARLFPAVRSAFRMLREASAQVRARPGPAVLTVSCTSGFASQWLLPRLSRFESLHPHVDVRISASNRIMDFARDRIDCAVRHGFGRDPGLISERLVDDDLTPVCSPRFAQDAGPFAAAADLGRVTLLHDEHRHDWALWLAAAGAPDIDASAGPVFVDGAGAADAAKAGCGVALVRRSMVRQELADGRLVAPFPQGCASDLAYHLVYPPGALDREPVAVFRDWLLAEAAA
ncbi:transcriptional regulator GcvA [Azospirillum sp. ST 5-10]|uniref:transcriptional regulator GcvA n=1 Tax=unclassified Azospirillum TaxID=2630922 RepID=UPI003F49DF23